MTASPTDNNEVEKQDTQVHLPQIVEKGELAQSNGTDLTAYEPDSGLSPWECVQGEPQLEETVREWLQERSAETVKAYMSDLRDFARWSNAKNELEAARDLLSHGPRECTRVVKKYKHDLWKKYHRKPKTINRRLSAIRSLIKLAKESTLITWDIHVRNVPESKNRDMRALTPEQFMKLVEAARMRKDIVGQRNVAALVVMGLSGLRRKEAFQLELEDFEPTHGEHGALWVLGKKRTEKELLPLGETARQFLDDWLEQRGDDPGAIFCSFHRDHQYQKMHINSVNKIFADLGKIAGVDANPHKFGRHTPATILATEYGALGVQEHLRHRDDRTANVYISRLNDKRPEMSQTIAVTLGLAKKKSQKRKPLEEIQETMTTMIDQIVEEQIAKWSNDPEKSRVLSEYMKRLSSNQWPKEEVSLICDRWASRQLTMEDAYCWMRYWDFYASGCVLRYEIDGIVSGPATDKMRDINQRTLDESLKNTAFSADVQNGPGPRCDGLIHWGRPLSVQQTFLSTDDGPLYQIHRRVLIDPQKARNSAELEIGTTSGPRSILHLLYDGLARWPYEHKRLTLLLPVWNYVPTKVLEDQLWNETSCLEKRVYSSNDAPRPLLADKANVGNLGIGRGLDLRHDIQLAANPWDVVKKQFKQFTEKEVSTKRHDDHDRSAEDSMYY